MDAVLVLLLAAALAAVALLVLRDRGRARELDRLAEVLDERGTRPARRARVESADADVARLADAVNRRLDFERERAVARDADEARFHEGLAALSHDLRTPLAGAQGYLQLLEREKDPERAARFLGGAEERLAAMRVLVDDLFGYARVASESFSLELGPVELEPSVTGALAGHYADLSSRGWEPELELPRTCAPVLADADALARIVDNLVANVVAHASGAPSVRVTVGADAVELAVENPVDPADAALLDIGRVFDDFYQADSARPSTSGTGLGLPTVRRLAAAMGADATAELTAGLEPLFCVRIRLRRAE